MHTLIQADDTWALWTVLSLAAVIAIYLEQTYKWASRVTGAIIALIIVMILSNLNLIPTESSVYDVVWAYVVPMAIPMLLFNANMKRIGKDSGRLLIIYMLSGFGTILGGFIGFFILRTYIPHLGRIVPMFVGTYTGGAVNFVAMSTLYEVPGPTISAALVADNLLMALYFFVLIALPAFNWVKQQFAHPYIDALETLSEDQMTQNQTMAAKYWGAKEISLKDIACTVALSLVIVTVSTKLAEIIGATFTGEDLLSAIIAGVFGNKYLMITTLTMLLASLFPQQLSAIKGNQEIGTFLIYLFFAVIGAPASIAMIMTESPLLLAFAFIVVIINLLVSLLIGKLCHFSIEEIIIASNANVGGPTTAAAMAVSKGWTDLIAPGLLVGTLGYVIGNYYGIFSGLMLNR